MPISSCMFGFALLELPEGIVVVVVVVVVDKQGSEPRIHT